jgi:3-deoxy-7-phosphoheptulonate synthase
MSDFNAKRQWGPTPNYPSVFHYDKPRSYGSGMLSIAGPCSIESPEQLDAIAGLLKSQGVTWLRGGVWKAGTYPPAEKDFGLVRERVKALQAAGKAHGLKTIAEVLDLRQLEYLDEHVDAFQVGARHMQDYALLTELAQSKKPVTLKRGLGNTLDEFLGAAEYLSRGRCQPILIERGGVSNLNHVRWDLSISLIAAAKRLTRIPVIVDASHGTGRRDLVEPMTMAGLAAGADGFLVECHPEPSKSWTDTDQSYPLHRVPELMDRARHIFESVTKWYQTDRSLSVTSAYAWGRHDIDPCRPRGATPIGDPAMLCYVCDSDEKFHSMGKLHPERELLVCKTCGNVCYRVEPSQGGEAMKNYYRHAYRPAPTHLNIVTTTNKQNYIRLFLKDWLKAKQKATERPLITTDIGCATGYIVAWLRSLGHRATGCELTLTFRRFAEHFYGIPVTEEVEKKHRYDLITVYHVLEHIPEPDKRLREWADLLAEDGHMLIATPEWFETLEEASGSEIADFTHLFHKDHINVFSARSLKNLFAKAGLVIEKEDHQQYGQTYLVKKVPATFKAEDRPQVVLEDYNKSVENILRAKEAIDAYKARDYTRAIAIWPKFPEAHLKIILEVNGKDPDAQRELWLGIKDLLGDNHRIMRGLAMWCYQQEKHEEALHILDGIMSFRPAADLYTWKAWVLCALNRYKEAMVAMQTSIELDPRRWQEATNWICALAVKMPAWDERALEQLKDTLLKQSGASPMLLDPVMDPELAEKRRAARDAAAAGAKA